MQRCTQMMGAAICFLFFFGCDNNRPTCADLEESAYQDHMAGDSDEEIAASQARREAEYGLDCNT
jgi:hypothetical protein